jgi:hypothetical protein
MVLSVCSREGYDLVPPGGHYGRVFELLRFAIPHVDESE